MPERILVGCQRSSFLSWSGGIEKLYDDIIHIPRWNRGWVPKSRGGTEALERHACHTKVGEFFNLKGGGIFHIICLPRQGRKRGGKY